MTSIAYILDNVAEYKTMLKNRYINNELIDNIQTIHYEYTGELIKLEKCRQLKNIISNEINNKKKDKSAKSTDIDNDFIELHTKNFDPEQLVLIDYSACSKNTLIKFGQLLKQRTDVYDISTKNLLISRNNLVNKVPNLLNANVPIDNNEDNNDIVCETEIGHKFSEENIANRNQFDICEKLEIIEHAGQIAGNRGYFLVNEGVRLNHALISYALDFMRENEYKLMSTPHFIRKEMIEQISQLSEFDETLYKLENSDMYLIATSEQPLTAYFQNKKVDSLPVKICGLSTCYRKEAGNHGVDTSGIFRVHQFEKVEQFCVTSPEKSTRMLREMCGLSEIFLSSLGLSHRVVNIVSGALNNAASIKYDIEGYFKGSGKYRELVSCSNVTDYFSRKINTKTSSGELCHMLNATLCANTRTLCCILEAHQTDDGVAIPKVLQKYYGSDMIKYPEI